MNKVKPELKVVPPERLLNIIENIEDGLAKALISFCYLTGARINEAIQFTKNDIEYKDKNRIEIKMKVLKRRDNNIRRFVIIPIGSNCKCYENELWNIVSLWIEKYSYDSYPFKKWKNMREYIRRKSNVENMNAITPDYRNVYISRSMHSHFFRHCRATHLNTYYSFDAYSMQNFFGWARFDTSTKYVHPTRTIEIFFGLEDRNKNSNV